MLPLFNMEPLIIIGFMIKLNFYYVLIQNCLHVDFPHLCINYWEKKSFHFCVHSGLFLNPEVVSDCSMTWKWRTFCKGQLLFQKLVIRCPYWNIKNLIWFSALKFLDTTISSLWFVKAFNLVHHATKLYIVKILHQFVENF